MKRRLICILLAALMLVGLIPGLAVEASAASAMTTSEKGIEFIKGFEGFSQYAYEDNNQYTIGYGTRCGKNEYPNGISKAEADALMRKSLVSMEAALNKFIDKHSLTLSQNQFDALMSFTFNHGAGWLTADGEFLNAVVNGLKGNDFIFCITLWFSNSEGHAKRRLAEADVYLNGYYATEPPSSFTYVLYDKNGGNSTDYKIQGYDACSPVAVRATPVYSGYRFLGWYTEKDGGQWVTHLDASTKGDTLYAHWQKDEGNVDENGNVLGDAVSYDRIASDALPVYDAPSGEPEILRTIAKGTTVSITADYVDALGIKWGQLKDGGWVQLSDTTVKTVADSAPVRKAEVTVTEPETPAVSVRVTITASSVNFRSGAGASQTKLGTLPYGTQVTITEVVDLNGVKWGKFHSGWICLLYTNYDTLVQEEPEQEESAGSTGTGDSGTTADPSVITGTVIDCGSLRVRSGAGTNYSILGSIPGGSRVQIYEKVVNGNMTWGRISYGWISLSYVKLDNDTTIPDTGSTGTGDSGSTTTPEEPPSDSSNAVTGWVTAGALNVRKGPGSNYESVGLLPRDTKVTITEQQKVNGTWWGKMDKGWICMNYVLIDRSTSENTNSGSTGSDNSGSDNTGSTGTSTGTTGSATGIVTASSLCVRMGAGTNFAVVKAIPRGTSVTITEQKLVNGTVWGKIESGWICMSYVQLDASSGSVSYTGTVTASSLCIRSAAGTGNAILGSYDRGEVVEILETTKVNGTTWGRTDKGWICMDYVK